MSQRQGGGGICTKNGSYCEKEKKVGEVGGGGQGRCEWRSEAFVKIQKKKKYIYIFFNFFFFFFFWGGGGVGSRGRGVRVDWGGGVQGGCEWRSEAFVKIQKKKIFWGGGGGGGGGGWVRGGRVGGSGWMGTEKGSLCENSKKNWGWGGGGLVGVGGGGVRVAVNGEVKLL